MNSRSPPAPLPLPAMPRSPSSCFSTSPKSLEVKAGATVTWMNGDGIEHSVTAGPPGRPDGAFDSGFFGKDVGFAFTFAKPGTYSYFCKRHPSMTAIAVVTQ